MKLKTQSGNCSDHICHADCIGSRLFFMVPSKIVMGSISGLALVFSQLTGISMSILTFLSKCHFACDRIFADWEGFWGEDNLHFDPASNLSLDL